MHPSVRRPGKRARQGSPSTQAVVSLEFPGIKLQMHYRAQNSLGEVAVKVTVEALDAREYKAGRKIFGNIRISAHAERAASIVREAALTRESERIDYEVLTLTFLIAQ